MTTLQNLLFPVRLIDNPNNTNSEYSKIVEGEIDGQVKHLNYCSPRFNLLQNSEVFPVIEEMLVNANCDFKKAYKINSDSTSFHAQYIIEKKDNKSLGINIGGNGDVCYPRVMVDNSYNGHTQADLTFGYFRLVCSNGLMLPLEGHEEKNFQIRGKHTEKLSLSFEQLIQKIDFFLSEQDTLKKRFEVLADRVVPNFEDRVIEVMNATNIATSKEQFNVITETIQKEAKHFNIPINDFLIYNGINAHIFKGVDSNGNKSKALPNVKRKTDKKVLNYMLELS